MVDGPDRPTTLPAYVRPRPGGSELLVRVVPRAGRSGLAGERDGALLVRLAAAPVEGAANTAMVRLLADALRVPRTSITIASGARSRDKRLAIAGVAADELARRLKAAGDARRSS
jgi:hypothetical protein